MNLNAAQWDAFLAGMVYAAGPKRAGEILRDDLELRETAGRLLEALAGDELELTGAELVAEHTGRRELSPEYRASTAERLEELPPAPGYLRHVAERLGLDGCTCEPVAGSHRPGCAWAARSAPPLHELAVLHKPCPGCGEWEWHAETCALRISVDRVRRLGPTLNGPSSSSDPEHAPDCRCNRCIGAPAGMPSEPVKYRGER
jgi:hypothetical protein